MASQTLVIAYSKNSDLVMSATDLKQKYFFGITLKDTEGNLMSDEDVEFHIRAAQENLQNELSVKFQRQVYQEDRDFAHDDWIQWNHVKTTYPVNKPLSLQGFMNTTQQIDYPQHWLSTKKQSNEEGLYHRSIQMVPISGGVSALSGNAIYTGISPAVGYFGSDHIPNYWKVKYITGFNKVPNDILQVMGMQAAIPILAMLGDLVAGGPGVTNQSISIDGLSQSVGTTKSASSAGYSARIKLYDEQIEKLKPGLTARYKGIIFAVA